MTTSNRFAHKGDASFLISFGSNYAFPFFRAVVGLCMVIIYVEPSSVQASHLLSAEDSQFPHSTQLDQALWWASERAQGLKKAPSESVKKQSRNSTVSLVLRCQFQGLVWRLAVWLDLSSALEHIFSQGSAIFIDQPEPIMRNPSN